MHVAKSQRFNELRTCINQIYTLKKYVDEVIVAKISIANLEKSENIE